MSQTTINLITLAFGLGLIVGIGATFIVILNAPDPRQIEDPSFVNEDGSPMTKEDYLKLDEYNK